VCQFLAALKIDISRSYNTDKCYPIWFAHFELIWVITHWIAIKRLLLGLGTNEDYKDETVGLCLLRSRFYNSAHDVTLRQWSHTRNDSGNYILDSALLTSMSVIYGDIFCVSNAQLNEWYSTLDCPRRCSWSHMALTEAEYLVVRKYMTVTLMSKGVVCTTGKISINMDFTFSTCDTLTLAYDEGIRTFCYPITGQMFKSDDLEMGVFTPIVVGDVSVEHADDFKLAISSTNSEYVPGPLIEVNDGQRSHDFKLEISKNNSEYVPGPKVLSKTVEKVRSGGNVFAHLTRIMEMGPGVETMYIPKAWFTQIGPDLQKIYQASVEIVSGSSSKLQLGKLRGLRVDGTPMFLRTVMRSDVAFKVYSDKGCVVTVVASVLVSRNVRPVEGSAKTGFRRNSKFDNNNKQNNNAKGLPSANDRDKGKRNNGDSVGIKPLNDKRNNKRNKQYIKKKMGGEESGNRNLPAKRPVHPSDSGLFTSDLPIQKKMGEVESGKFVNSLMNRSVHPSDSGLFTSDLPIFEGNKRQDESHTVMDIMLKGREIKRSAIYDCSISDTDESSCSSD